MAKTVEYAQCFSKTVLQYFHLLLKLPKIIREILYVILTQKWEVFLLIHDYIFQRLTSQREIQKTNSQNKNDIVEGMYSEKKTWSNLHTVYDHSSFIFKCDFFSHVKISVFVQKSISNDIGFHPFMPVLLSQGFWVHVPPPKPLTYFVQI